MALNMQWLIDIILDLIPATPGYVSRGTTFAFDFESGDFVQDDTWRQISLAGIVPEGTVAVHLRVSASTNFILNRIRFRKNILASFANVADTQFHVAGRAMTQDKIVSLDTSREMQYRIVSTGWTTFGITVAGWFGPET